MKKCVLVLLTFVPFIVGHIVNRSISIPVIGSIVFYVCHYLQQHFGFTLADNMLAVLGKRYRHC